MSKNLPLWQGAEKFELLLENMWRRCTEWWVIDWINSSWTENWQMDRTKVGRYEKLEKIGEGTYGTVFKGTAPDGSLGNRSRIFFGKKSWKNRIKLIFIEFIRKWQTRWKSKEKNEEKKLEIKIYFFRSKFLNFFFFENLTPGWQMAFWTPFFPFGLKWKSLLRRHVMISVTTFSPEIETISSSLTAIIYIFDIFYHFFTFEPWICEVWKGENLCPLAVKS